MTSRRVIEAHLGREVAKRDGAETGKADKATPQQTLVRAAETGRFEAIVAAAQPAEPPKMVTPEEREAERRANGQWPDEPKAEPQAETVTPEAPPAPEPGMPTEPTAGMTWAEENMSRRPHGSRDYREPVPYGRCMTEYDVLTGEIIGDGYDHSGEEDDEW